MPNSLRSKLPPSLYCPQRQAHGGVLLFHWALGPCVNFRGRLNAFSIYTLFEGASRPSQGTLVWMYNETYSVRATTSLKGLERAYFQYMPKLEAQIVGNIGLYYVSYRRSQLGWNVMLTARTGRLKMLCN